MATGGHETVGAPPTAFFRMSRHPARCAPTFSAQGRDASLQGAEEAVGITAKGPEAEERYRPESAEVFHVRLPCRPAQPHDADYDHAERQHVDDQVFDEPLPPPLPFRLVAFDINHFRISAAATKPSIVPSSLAIRSRRPEISRCMERISR